MERYCELYVVCWGMRSGIRRRTALRGAGADAPRRTKPEVLRFERGVTYYNLVSNQFTGLNAIVISGTLRDSLYVLAVVLEQQADLQPAGIMTGTGAHTDVVFGLFWLLGYRFCPRIADIGRARYWRIDPSADYGLPNGIASRRISTKLIEENWDDMLRLAGYCRSSSTEGHGIAGKFSRGFAL